MDLRSLSLGEKIAAAAGGALFVLLFFAWIESESAWKLFAIVDVLLAILALAALALPLARAAGVGPQLRPSMRTVLLRIGVVALAFILAYFLEAFGDAQIGLWLSVLAAGALLYGASTIPGEDEAGRPQAGRRRDRTRRERRDDDFEEPPAGMESWRSGSGYSGGAETEGSPGDPGDRSGLRERAARGHSPEADYGKHDRAETPSPRRPPEVPPARGT